MKTLIISPPLREKINSIIELADKSMFVITSDITYTAPLKDLSIIIPIGFYVTYTVEKQPIGYYKHLSVSIDDEDMLPNPAAIEMIMKEFNFKKKFNDSIVKVIPCGEFRDAVNIQEAIE